MIGKTLGITRSRANRQRRQGEVSQAKDQKLGLRRFLMMKQAVSTADASSTDAPRITNVILSRLEELKKRVL